MLYEIVKRKYCDPFRVTLVGNIKDGNTMITINTYSKEKFETEIIQSLTAIKDYNPNDVDEPFVTRLMERLEIPWDEKYGCFCYLIAEAIVEYIDPDTGILYEVMIG